MFYHSPKSIRIVSAAVFLLSLSTFLFAKESTSDSAGNRGKENSAAAVVKPAKEKEETLSELQLRARLYRSQGLEFQSIGNLDAAMSLYQKAIELDPRYAIAYNDLGIVYEVKGFTDRAEESYLKAIKIDRYFLSAYSNLAILYENKRELAKAAFYWQKRLEFGSSDDPWKEKARMRLEDIRMVLSAHPIKDAQEKEVRELVNDVTAKPKPKPKPKIKAKLTLSEEYFKNAKESYLKQDYAAAFKEALDAAQLDPTNKDIEKFIERVEAEALRR